MTAPLSALQAGRVWFATRPQFYATQATDSWRCGGFFCHWDQTRWSWCAYTRSGPHRWAQTPAAALAAVGYVDPEATP